MKQVLTADGANPTVEKRECDCGTGYFIKTWDCDWCMARVTMKITAHESELRASPVMPPGWSHLVLYPLEQHMDERFYCPSCTTDLTQSGQLLPRRRPSSP